MAASGLRQCLRDVTFYLVSIIAVSTLGSLLFGFHLAELNAPQDVLTCKTHAVSSPSDTLSKFPQCIPMTEAEFAAISSIYTLGGLLGALCAGPISSTRGRLPAMRLTSYFFIIGGSFEALAGNIPVMATGRLLSGVGAGAATVIVPMFISEVAPPREKGLFGAMTQVTCNIGILLTQTLGYFLSNGSRWRLILASGVGISILQFIGLLFVPETPAWLAAHKHPQKAIRTLQRIRGHGIPIDEEIENWDVNSSGEDEGLLAGDAEEPTVITPLSPANKKSVSHVGFFEAMKDPLYQPAIVAVIGIMFTQQFTGINSIMMYSVSLLSGLLPVSSGLLTILISVINLTMTILCSPLPDRIGRKKCLLLSTAGMGFSSFALASALRVEAKVVAAFAVLSFTAFFATGLGPVPFMIASEFVGQEAVGAIQSWSLAANYICTFAVAQFFPILNQALNNRFGGSGWSFFVFAAMALVGFIFISFRVPETKGKKDADEVWGRVRRVD
ncbi:general substrate transporter [Xylogone sp. PMI_703]|nr:general substrate transporter [Xylogone sp. PMI_703]